jgi:hypothetical protein
MTLFVAIVAGLDSQKPLHGWGSTTLRDQIYDFG